METGWEQEEEGVFQAGRGNGLSGAGVGRVVCMHQRVPSLWRQLQVMWDLGLERWVEPCLGGLSLP